VKCVMERGAYIELLKRAIAELQGRDKVLRGYWYGTCEIRGPSTSQAGSQANQSDALGMTKESVVKVR